MPIRIVRRRREQGRDEEVKMSENHRVLELEVGKEMTQLLSIENKNIKAWLWWIVESNSNILLTDATIITFMKCYYNSHRTHDKAFDNHL